MYYIIGGLSFQCALIYLDDIIVFSESFRCHLRDFRIVFDRLHHFQCPLNLSNCHFASQEIEYLGHIVNPTGIRPKHAFLKAVQLFPSPATVTPPVAGKKAMKSFVPLSNFYRSFIRSFAQIAAPLISLTRKKVDFVWQRVHDSAFAELKN